MFRSLIAIPMLLVLAPALLSAAELEASVDWAQRVTLSTPVSGVVAEVPVTPGSEVRKDQVLLRLDAANFNTRITRARAAEESRRYAMAEDKREYERARELYDRTVLSDHDLKIAEIAYKTSAAHHSAAKAELDDARKALEDSVIKAPFDGVVIATHVAPSETVVTALQNVPMVSLGMTGRYRAVAKLNATSIAALHSGDSVRVRVAGKEYSGRIEHVGVEADAEGRYSVAAAFESGELLRSGMPATLLTQ